MPTLKQEQARALSLGHVHFISSNKCLNGHSPTIRYAKSGGCVDCQRNANRAVAARSLGVDPESWVLCHVSVRVPTSADVEKVRQFANMLCGKEVNHPRAMSPLVPPCPPPPPKPLEPFDVR